MNIETSRRALLAGLAIAPVALATPAATLAHPDGGKFERRLARYRARRAADERDVQFGALRHAYDAFDSGHISFEQMSEAEDVHHRRFQRPRWRAAKLVFQTPAPTMAALATKIGVARSEGDGSKPDSAALACIVADAERLTGGAQ
jgi:hypothetical protein